MGLQTSSLHPRILVAPLDWGLGHATRCIPVIHELITNKCDVLLAGEGRVASLLKAEFPQLFFLSLQGYNISYGNNKWEAMGRMLLQIPKIIEAMDEEHEWLKGVIDTHKINAVISDNRYGLFNEAIYSVFITHQLLIKTSLGNAADEALQKLNYEYVNAFDECWVPDVAGVSNLSGDLSHPQKMPAIPVHYPGALSRMKRGKLNGGRHLLILLSGPEPQRTQLEELLITQLERYKDPVVFVRGLPGDTDLPPVPENVYAVNHLSAPEMQEAMEEASFVVSRCGYSTIMDIMVLRKRSILIPTPGQTEQEYLAQHLMQQNGALCIPQSKFKLMNALELAGSFNYKEGNFEDAPALQTTVRNFVEKLRANDVVNEPV